MAALDSRAYNFGEGHLPDNRLQLVALVDAGRSSPIQDVRESPRILTQVQLQLTLAIHDQLCRGVEASRALALVLIVEFQDACGQIEGLRLGVEEGFTKADLAIGDEHNLPTGWRWSHSDVGAVVAERTCDFDVAYRLHLCEGIDQPLVLGLGECLDQSNPVGRRREVIDVQRHTDGLAHLRSGAPCLRLDGFILRASVPSIDAQHGNA
jgi:hypothetical protein